MPFRDRLMRAQETMRQMGSRCYHWKVHFWGGHVPAHCYVPTHGECTYRTHAADESIGRCKTTMRPFAKLLRTLVWLSNSDCSNVHLIVCNDSLYTGELNNWFTSNKNVYIWAKTSRHTHTKSNYLFSYVFLFVTRKRVNDLDECFSLPLTIICTEVPVPDFKNQKNCHRVSPCYSPSEQSGYHLEPLVVACCFHAISATSLSHTHTHTHTHTLGECGRRIGCGLLLL